MTGVQVQGCTEGKTSSLRAAEAVSAHLYSSLSVCAITSLITEKRKKGQASVVFRLLSVPVVTMWFQMFRKQSNVTAIHSPDSHRD